MTKKRIPLEIKPCCSNCDLRECESCKDEETNPCQWWKPDKGWFTRRLDAEIKLTKEKK